MPWIQTINGKDINSIDPMSRNGKSVHYEYTSDAYEQALEKYKGDPEALARINAGVRSFDYRPTVFDAWTSQFGGTATQDKMMAQYALDYDKYLSEVLNNLQTRDYNSEEAKVTRMRNAGLNPDLQGLSQASEQTAAIPDETLPDPSGIMSQNQDRMLSIGNSISQNALSLVTGMFSLGKMFFDIQGSKLDNAGKEISNVILGQEAISAELGNETKASDVALRGLLAMTPSDIKADVSFDDVFTNMIDAASKSDFADYSPGTAKLLRKMYSRYSGELNNGKPSLELEKLKTDFQKAISDNKLGIAHNAAQPGYSDDDLQMIRDIGEITSRYYMRLQKLEFEAKIKSFEKSKSVDDYQKDYYDTLNPYSRAIAENATYRRSRLDTEFEEANSQIWKDLMTTLKDSKSKWAPFGMLLLPALRSWITKPSIPSFHISSSEGSNASEWSKQGGFSQGSNRSRTFGFN